MCGSGVVIVRMGGEIGIKSRPVRSIYERMLAKIIRSSLERDGIKFSKISRAAGRIYVHTDEAEKVSKKVAHIFGVSSASAGVSTSSELEEIIKKGTELAITHFRPGSFSVRCRRSGKHDYTSVEVASLLGKAILEAKKDLRVDLDSPDQTLYVEIREDMAYIYLDSLKGPDGFPVGTQDPLLGVIDETKESLLASWCMLKRGVSLRAVTYEIGGEVPKGAVNNLKVLLEWMPNASLETIVAPLPTDCEEFLTNYELVAAIQIARREGIAGVVSGLRPRSVKEILPLSRLEVQAFFPLMVLEDGTLDGWSKYIGVGEYRPDERVFGTICLSGQSVVESFYSRCEYKKLKLSPGGSHF